MKRRMIFKQTYYDAQELDGRQSISFFTENAESDEKIITGLNEDEAIRWLFQKIWLKNFLIGSFFHNPSKVKPFFGLTEPFTTRGMKPGDIDLLLIDIERPDLSIAFECKRVKVTSTLGQNPKVNNSQSINKGIDQANKYSLLGFHKTYLMIILLDDARFNENSNIRMRNTDPKELDPIYEIPWNKKLNDEVGVVYVRISQQTGKNINLMGGVGICEDKRAIGRLQTQSINNKIKELMNESLI